MAGSCAMKNERLAEICQHQLFTRNCAKQRRDLGALYMKIDKCTYIIMPIE
jgi:hypothetical protein